MKKYKKLGIVLGLVAVVCITFGVSYSLFNYSRTGATKTEIVTGNLEFSYIEGDSATITEAFPVSDSIGATDTAGQYTFTVGLKASSDNYMMNYNVIFIDNNNDSNNVFKNDQIKYALIKNGTYVANTSSTKGVKLSEIDGFDSDLNGGSGEVLSAQEIVPGATDSYILRIWISDDVSYSNTIDDQDAQTSTGKYNNYTYSLKVKIEGQLTTTKFSNLNIDEQGKFSVDVEDENGLKQYAIKQENSLPSAGEWIDIDSAVSMSKSNIIKVASNIVKNKTITYDTSNVNGVYFVFVKNNMNMIAKKAVNVYDSRVVIFLDPNGGEVEETSKKIDPNGTYNGLPNATREGYSFVGWYTDITGGELVDENTNYSSLNVNTLYAHWEEIQGCSPVTTTKGNWQYTDSDCDNTLNLGDKIKISNESFYIISNDNTTIKALAEWNLDIDSNDSYEYQGTGLQNENVRGRTYGAGSSNYGVVAFASEFYWSSVELTLNNSKNMINSYLVSYKNILLGLNSNISDVTLMTKEDLEMIYNNVNGTEDEHLNSSDMDSWAPAWLYQTSYWTKSSHSSLQQPIWTVRSDHYFDYISYTTNNMFGVRPVITISTSYFN